jgi:hypothetical protein
MTKLDNFREKSVLPDTGEEKMTLQSGGVSLFTPR